MNHLPVNLSTLERLGAPLLRPTLQITYRGPRIGEEVSVHYPSRVDQWSEAAGSSTVSIVQMSSASNGRAKYVRAWVHNLFGFPARACQVFVDRIALDGRAIETERSPLHWADLDKTFELPAIRYGYKNGHYIDICATDSIDPRFQIISQKWMKGYHRFSQTGTYEIEMTAEAAKPCSFGHFVIKLGYETGSWKSLRIESAREGRGLSRWW